MYLNERRKKKLSCYSKRIKTIFKKGIAIFCRSDRKLSYKSQGGGYVTVRLKTNLFLAVRVYFHLLQIKKQKRDLWGASENLFS